MLETTTSPINPSLTADDYLRMIHEELDGTVWDADTPAVIAEILREAGFDVREPGADA